jgi:hypothetical protein
VLEHRRGDRAEEQDVGLIEDRFVGVAVDPSVCRDPLAADALGRDARDELP